MARRNRRLGPATASNRGYRVVCAIALFALVAGVLLPQSTAGAATSGFELSQGQGLSAGQSISSPSGEYTLTMRTDGDLVETAPGRTLFSSNTASGVATLRLQADGNLVIYSASSQPLWASSTVGQTNEILQIDGTGLLELVSDGRRVWSAASTQLRPGDALHAGGRLYSPNLRYQLVLQADGNLVLYGPTRVVWNTGTVGDTGDFLTLQTDGNLVLYSAASAPLFWSGTSGRSSVLLSLGNDSSLNLTTAASLVWGDPAPTVAAGTMIPAGETVRSVGNQFSLEMQADGNLVLYQAAHPLWATNTYGNSGAYAVMQADGNLAVYNTAGQPLFDTETYGHGSAYLDVQTDGNAVVYGAGGALWSSRAGNATTERAAQAAVAAGNARGERAAVAVYDRATGRYYTAGDADSYYASASVMKVFIATKLLVTGQATDPSIAALMWRMITLSDDNAADTLYGDVGGADVASWAASRYGIAGIAPTPIPEYWGLTQITARGMVSYYNAVARDPIVGPWLLNAMANMQAPAADGWPQQFGIPSVTNGWRVKQGWMCCLDGLTRIHSTGFVNSDRYTVAILTEGPPSVYGQYGNSTVTIMASALLPGGAIPH